MPRKRNLNIDQKTNKPEIRSTESVRDDQLFDRSSEIRRDDDVIKTPKRTVYNIDFAIKWFIENQIQPKIQSAGGELVDVPVIYSNAEKWDSVRRLGYLRDEKGMLQSPLIILKRNSLQERDQLKKLDINRFISGNNIVYKQQYNKRNQYIDELFPIPNNQRANSSEMYAINIPEYVDIEYDLLLWTDFTTQMNELVEQFMPYGGFAWGNDSNKYRTHIRTMNFETINTVGNDRLVRCTVPLTVNGTLLGEQEYRVSTIQKKYSLKKLVWDFIIDVDDSIFESLDVPQKLLDMETRIISGARVLISKVGGGTPLVIDVNTMEYLTQLQEKTGTVQNSTTVTINDVPGTNPVTLTAATKSEFNIYINGQYIDKALYTWTPSLTPPQTIIFDIAQLGYSLDTDDIIIINGRWTLNP